MAEKKENEKTPPPPPVVEEKKEPVKVPEAPKEEEKTESQETIEKAQAILRQYGGLESQIPTSNEYWGLMNTYRAQVEKEKLERERER